MLGGGSAFSESRRPAGLGELCLRSWHLLAYTFAAGAVISATTPNRQYVQLNYFAAKHTGLNRRLSYCELDVSSEHCLMAAADQEEVNQLITPLVPLVQVCVAPIVGLLSDAYGRKPLLLLMHALGMLELLSLLAVAFSEADVWLQVAASLVNSDSIWRLTLVAVIGLDLAEEPSERVLLSALISVAYLLSVGLTSCMASLVGMEMALTSAALIAVVSTMLLILVPETLPVYSRKASLSLVELLPGVSMRILWRDRLVLLLAAMALVGGVETGASDRVLLQIWQRSMNVTERCGLWLLGVSLVSAVACLLAVKPLTQALGEVGALILAAWVVVAHTLMQFLATNVPVLLIGRVLGGAALVTHVVSMAVRSKLVTEAEQGVMQFAMSTVTCLAISWGSVGSAWAYETLMSYGGDPPIGAIWGVGCMGLAALLALQAMQLPSLIRGYCSQVTDPADPTLEVLSSLKDAGLTPDDAAVFLVSKDAAAAVAAPG